MSLICDMGNALVTHSSTLAWKIPWTEEPGRLQSMGSLRVGRDWATSLSLSGIGEGNGNPLQCSCLENPRDGGAWWAAVYGVTQSQTWLTWLNNSSSICDIHSIYLSRHLPSCGLYPRKTLLDWFPDFWIFSLKTSICLYSTSDVKWLQRQLITN